MCTWNKNIVKVSYFRQYIYINLYLYTYVKGLGMKFRPKVDAEKIQIKGSLTEKLIIYLLSFITHTQD